MSFIPMIFVVDQTNRSDISHLFLFIVCNPKYSGLTYKSFVFREIGKWSCYIIETF